jgi:transcriptional regulator with XRE-family HTH domain
MNLMFDKLSDNLNLLMANARINASELARKTGVPASTIKKIRNRDNPNPTLTTLIPIAQNFALSVSQLVGDEQLPTPNSSFAHSFLPLLNWEDAQYWPEVSAERYSPSQIINQYHANSFALTINEDNWDGFSKHSTIIIDPSITAEHQHFVLVYKEGGSLPVIRQLLIDDDVTYLKPLISGYLVSQLTAQHRIIGVAIEIRRTLNQ